MQVRLPGEKPVPALQFVSPELDPAPVLHATGSDFDPGAQIYVGGVARATTFVDSTHLTTPLGPSESGGLVKVVNPGPGGGSSAGLPLRLWYMWMPAVRR